MYRRPDMFKKLRFPYKTRAERKFVAELRQKMKTSEIATLKTWITESDNIVFLEARGVSTESGIPDFRSVDGLYHQKFDYPPETILSHSFFYSHTEEFYRFYREKMLPLEAKPNAAHLALAKLEQEGKLKAIVTQNIDGLHQKAGSKCVYEPTALCTATAASAAASSIPPEFIRDFRGHSALRLRRAHQARGRAL